jgi:response regulator RpfG family c-di-GMP phosphodiesterase
VREVVRHHHERWDGTGYPDRLTGEAIPLPARIVSVADAVEAMSADRPYRSALDPDAVVAELRAGRASQWDPAVVDAVLALVDSGIVLLQPGEVKVVERRAEDRPDTLSVLLVEDDADHAELVAEIIRRTGDGIRVVHAADLASAEHLLRECAWSLAVLDHNLPDGSGLELLESIRRLDPDVPVLMMTGEGSERVAVEAFRRGASDYVVKGDSSMKELQTRVRDLLAA